MGNDANKNSELKNLPNSQQLAQEKIKARQELLSLSPSVAQQQVDQILHPELWEFNIKNHSWEESIPTHYGEVDP